MTVKSSLKNKNCLVEPKGNANVQHSKLNANSKLLCVKCNGCMLSDNHDLCVLDFINDVNARNACPLTRITTTTEVPLRKPTALKSDTPKPLVTLVYSRKPKKTKTNVLVSKSKINKSISANTKEPSKSWGSIVFDVPSFSLDECRSSKLFTGTIKFGNDHVGKILGYGEYQIGNVMILKVYYVEGLGHNLFFVGKFCDSNLEVAFRQHTCFIRNLEGVDLLTGSQGNNLYTLSLGDMMVSSPTSRHGFVRGLLKLRFENDHLCSAYAMGKSKKKPHKPKFEDTNQEKLYLLHMDLCGPMYIASVNGKNKSWRSIVFDVPSFSLDECRSSKLFTGTVKFRNDHVEKILGYGEYQIGNVMILRVYYVEGLGHNLFFVGKFCDSNLEVAFRQHTCFIRNLEGVDLLIGSQGNNLYTLSLGDMMASSPTSRHGFVRGLLKLRFEKDHLCSAYAMGKSKKKPHKPKSEDTNQEKLYLLHMDLCGPMYIASVNGKKTGNGTEFVNQTLREYYEKVGISHETSVARSPHNSGPALHEMTPVTISLGPVLNPPHSTPFVPPLRTDWDLLFQSLFDELLTPPPSIDHPVLEVLALIAEVVAPEPAASTGLPSSTIVDQDAPSPNVAYTNNDPFFGIQILENDSKESSSSDVIPTVVHTAAPYSKHVTKWTKDHPLDNIINELERHVSTRLQLHKQALFYYYDAFLTSVEPKNYEDALTQACWIEAIDPVDTPMVEKSKLDEDTQRKAVDPTYYRGMVGTL
nr:hypothetical protein [Tanacetum cinerariifolium]